MCSTYEETVLNAGRAAKMVNSTNRGIVLIRHSIRDPIPDSGSTFRMMLTDDGRKAARILGERINKGRHVTLFHSPVPRCGETARCIMEGHGRGVVAGAREYLRCRYILDEETVFRRYEELGADGFISDWFRNRIEKDILEPPAVAATKLLSALLEEEGEGVRVHVTHDWNILLVLGLVYHLGRNERHWPGFLDGVLIERRRDKVEITYRGETRTGRM